MIVAACVESKQLRESRRCDAVHADDDSQEVCDAAIYALGRALQGPA